MAENQENTNPSENKQELPVQRGRSDNYPLAHSEQEVPTEKKNPFRENLTDILSREVDEHSREGGARPDVLGGLDDEKQKLVAANTDGFEYSVEDHMAVSRRSYSVPPEIVFGAAKWIGGTRFTPEVMGHIVKVYSERKVNQ